MKKSKVKRIARKKARAKKVNKVSKVGVYRFDGGKVSAEA